MHDHREARRHEMPRERAAHEADADYGDSLAHSLQLSQARQFTPAQMTAAQMSGRGDSPRPQRFTRIPTFTASSGRRARYFAIAASDCFTGMCFRKNAAIGSYDAALWRAALSM